MNIAERNLIPLVVDKVQYTLTVHDYGTHWKVRVYQDEKLLGFQDHPFRVEITKGVMTYTVRSIVRQNAKEQAKV